jgi:type IV pilus assembly protein PilQ
LVENGGTVVLGGLFQQTDTNTVDKVPLLGDIPVLGNLFKTTTKISNRTELLIFITPRIITDRTVAH